MKYKLLAVCLTLVLSGCLSSGKSRTPTYPTPFEPDERQIKLQGCEDLKAAIEEWNENHPQEEPREADC